MPSHRRKHGTHRFAHSSNPASTTSVRLSESCHHCLPQYHEKKRPSKAIKIAIDKAGLKRCVNLLLDLQPWLEIGLAPSKGDCGWAQETGRSSDKWHSKQGVPNDLSRRATEGGKREDSDEAGSNGFGGGGSGGGKDDDSLTPQRRYRSIGAEERATVILGLRAFQAITDFKLEIGNGGSQAIILRLALLKSGSILPSLQSIFGGDVLFLEAITGEEAARCGLELRIPGDEFVVGRPATEDAERFEYILVSKDRRGG